MHLKNYPMTEFGKEKLAEELVYLKEVKQRELSEEIKEHRSYCDFSDNASFGQTLDQQAILKDRISIIEEMLLNAILIDPKEKQAGIVRLGSTVTFKELPDGGEETYTIVGKIEVDPLANKISLESPIGNSLLNHQKK